MAMVTRQNCTESVLNGLEIGYRLIDTAQVYGNEEEVGTHVSSTSIPSKDYFLATKIFITKLNQKTSQFF